MQTSPKTSGFSLVEISLALGIAAVALVTVVGLLGVGISTNSGSNLDTNYVAMSRQVMSAMRAVDFDALWDAKLPKGEVSTRPAGAVPADSFFYFAQDGSPVDESSFEAVFECRVKKTLDPDTQTYNGAFNLLRLEMVFTSPVSAPADKRATNQTVYASIARY